jgi:CheY-like chemotaxis protein
VRAFTVSCLESLGYEVRVAEGGHAALAILGGRENTDLLLIDVIMPEVRGPEVARLALAKRPELRILFMTVTLRRQAMRSIATMCCPNRSQPLIWRARCRKCCERQSPQNSRTSFLFGASPVLASSSNAL